MSDCQHCTPCTLERIEGALSRLELAMAKASEAINNLSGKFDELGALTTDIHSDLEAMRVVLSAERENLTDAGVAALDAANAKADATMQKLRDLDVAVGDADGSDIPTDGSTGGSQQTPATPGDTAPPAGEGTVVNPDVPGDGGEQDFRPTV